MKYRVKLTFKDNGRGNTYSYTYVATCQVLKVSEGTAPTAVSTTTSYGRALLFSTIEEAQNCVEAAFSRYSFGGLLRGAEIQEIDRLGRHIEPIV